MASQKEPALFYRKVYAVVRQIPPGQVTSYGRIAEMLGVAGAARQVGYAMSALKNRGDDPQYADVPWQRVVAVDGKIVIKGPGPGRFRQAELLRDEGVFLDDDLRVDMQAHIWEGLLPHEVDQLLEKDL
ncbi:MGMT family protein [bacterium]|nr:MGMT family protein [bacterium]MCB2179329.1 MGMT family protein [bacterium]